MVTIRSLVQVGGDLVPVEELAVPVADEDYIEGAIELSIGHKPILTREQVDLVDQLWAYLVQGLEDVAQGLEFSTYYPDMPVKIVLRPEGKFVAIHVDKRRSTVEARVAMIELRDAMIAAGTHFFESLRPWVTQGKASCDLYLARLTRLRAATG